MFDVGFAELFLLSLIGLLVLGPERLPRVARTIGGLVRKARTSWISLRNTIVAEMDNADIASPIKQAGEEFKQIGKDIADATNLKAATQQSSAPDAQTEMPADKEPVAAEKSDAGKDENA